ncbi:MAG: UDP-N-acetylmuramate--L-alanine ligase [Anaerolineae bacterium]
MSHIHLIGIGGAGMSAIAVVLLQQNHTVSGSDVQESETTERLRRLGAEIYTGHRAEQVQGAEVVVVSSAIPADNPEVRAARARGISVVKRPAWLGRMMAGKRGIAVAGTHGKTTTTAMLAFMLSRAGLSPTYIVGGFVPQLNSNAAAGRGDWFVIEADEYDRTFLSLKPEIAVITNIEWDHPDTYPRRADLRRAFAGFAALVPPHGQILICGDDRGAQRLGAGLPAATTYGLARGNTWQAVNVTPNERGGFSFLVRRAGQLITPKPVALSVPGRHNVQNGLAALAAASAAGLKVEQAGQFLSEFAGTGRRFEWKGEAGGVTVIDDYAHHPTEIKATLAAARSRFGARPIWAVFQPHTFSRTRLLLAEFAAAFADADHAVILDIFPARETDDGSIHSADIVARMNHPDARHLGSIAGAAAYLQTRLSPGDVLITLGAGDGYKVGDAILQHFEGDMNHNL